MEKPTVPNKVIDPDTRGELWFMAHETLSDSQVLLLLKIYLRMGRKFPGDGQVVKVDTRDLGFTDARPTLTRQAGLTAIRGAAC
ncbi:MAG: hypothetical protein JWR69_2698 [Pedosphaera sp.]|nr:hypothetical protein [Pedosphaera sp.]